MNHNESACFTKQEPAIGIDEVASPGVEPDQVIVQMQAVAINHRANWICKGMYPHIQPAVVLGSEGRGTCYGHEVITNPSKKTGVLTNVIPVQSA